MTLKAFFVDALTSALDLGIGQPDDLMRHISADVLAQHLPRALWARLLTACLGAPKVDAQLVVETIGVPNLCEHVPQSLLWACIADIAARALGKAPEEVVPLVTRSSSTTASGTIAAAGTAPVTVAPATGSAPVANVPLAPPPPESMPPSRPTPQPQAKGPAIPAPQNAALSDLYSEGGEGDEKPAATLRARTPTSQRFRQSNTGINRPIGSTGARRPQASATATPARPSARRGETDSESVTETAVESNEMRGGSREIAVDDSQLVDWTADNTALGDDDFGDIGRKR